GWPQVNGRVGRLADGRLGRFGWKAQTATLRDFVLSAAAIELGLEVPGQAQAADPRVPPLKAPGLDLNRGECDAVTAFVRALPRPVVAPPVHPRHESARKGRYLFHSIVSAGCGGGTTRHRAAAAWTPRGTSSGGCAGPCGGAPAGGEVPPARPRRPGSGSARRDRGVADAPVVGPARLGALPPRRPRQYA